MHKRFAVFITALFAVGALVVFGVWQSSRSQKTQGFRVAVFAPLTGPAASGGLATKEGFELSIDSIRKNGGQIQVEYIDTKSEPKTAISAFEQVLAINKPDAVVLELSSVTRAIAPQLKGRVFALATAVAVPNIARPQDNLVRFFSSSTGVAATAASEARRRGIKNCAIFYVNDDYGSESARVFKEAFTSTGGSVLAQESFELLGRDLRSQIATLLALNAESIWVTGYGPGYLAALNQLRELDFKGAILTDWSITSPDYFSAVHDKEGMLVIAPAVSTELEKDYRGKYGKEGFMVNVAFAYDSLILLHKAFELSDGSPTSITKAFLDLGDFDGACGPIHIRKDGDVDVMFTVFQVRGNALQKTGK